MPPNPKDQPWTGRAIRIVEQHWDVPAHGYATSGHARNSDHYSGNALDADVPGSDSQLRASGEGKRIGDEIADYFTRNARALGTKYVIWNGRINNLDGEGWALYQGGNRHTGHVHVSFQPPGTGLPVPGGGAAADALPLALSGARGIAVEWLFVGLGVALAGLGAWRVVAPQARKALRTGLRSVGLA